MLQFVFAWYGKSTLKSKVSFKYQDQEQSIDVDFLFVDGQPPNKKAPKNLVEEKEAPRAKRKNHSTTANPHLHYNHHCRNMMEEVEEKMNVQSEDEEEGSMTNKKTKEKVEALVAKKT